MIRDEGLAGQRFTERPPVASLAGLVSTVWIQMISAEAAPYAHWGIPDGRIEIACEIGAVPRITGARTGPGVAILSPTTIVGIRFHPAAAAAVLRIPPRSWSAGRSRPICSGGHRLFKSVS